MFEKNKYDLLRLNCIKFSNIIQYLIEISLLNVQMRFANPKRKYYFEFHQNEIEFNTMT